MSKNKKILDNKEQSKISGGFKAVRCPKCEQPFSIGGEDSQHLRECSQCRRRYEHMLKILNTPIGPLESSAMMKQMQKKH